MRVSADPNTQMSAVRLADRTVFSGLYLGTDAPRLGVNDVDASTAPEFRGTIRPRPVSTELCRRLVDG
jgi:hypothetical protein